MKIRTNAPEAYDYTYATRSCSYWHEVYPGGPEIVVADVYVADDSNGAYQADRYRSGSYFVEIVSQANEVSGEQ